MKLIACLTAALGLLLTSVQAEPDNKSCPIDGNAPKAGIKSDYSKTAALCCNKCKASFEANPKGYLTNILTAHSGQCPLSKKAIKTAVNVTYKREVGFCSTECKAKFDAAPDKFIKDVR